MAKNTIAVLGVGYMGQSALRILARHRRDDGFLVFDPDERALADAAPVGPQRVRTKQADLLNDDLDLSGCSILLNLAGLFFTGSDRAARAALAHGVALAEDEHAFPDGIITTSAAAPAGGTR